jgi:hypothetical protein
VGLFSKIKKQAKKEFEGLNKDGLGKELDGLINTANMRGSNILGKMMLRNLTFNVESSQKFKNSEDQVDSFLDKYPSMLIYREEIIEKARKFRKDNGLEE